jgi:hypothetical protein
MQGLAIERFIQGERLSQKCLAARESTTRTFSENLLAIDGSKSNAVNHCDRNFTSAELKRWMEEIETSIVTEGGQKPLPEA